MCRLHVTLTSIEAYGLKTIVAAAPTIWGLEGPSPLGNNSVGAEPTQKF